jgi:hypothetical protein
VCNHATVVGNARGVTAMVMTPSLTSLRIAGIVMDKVAVFYASETGVIRGIRCHFLRTFRTIPKAAASTNIAYFPCTIAGVTRRARLVAVCRDCS